MTSNRVKFSDVAIIHKIPIDRSSVSARQKFTFTKSTKYDPQNCEVCKISCNSKIIYEMHVNGKKHNKALEKLKLAKFPCETCSLTLDDLNTWQTHLSSLEHKHTQLKNFTGITSFIVPNKINYCDVCKLDCGSNIILQSHLTGAKHKRKLKLLQIEKLIESKDSSVYCEICGISLEPELMLLHKLSGKHKKANTKENKLNLKSKRAMEFCALCEKDLSVITEAIEHYKSIDHLDNVKNKENILWCEICKIILPDQSMMSTHLKGFRHYRILNREESLFEGTFKEKLILKRQKQKELRAHYEKEKNELEHID